MAIIRTLFNRLLVGIVLLSSALVLPAPVLAQSNTDQGLTATITCDCSKTYAVGDTVPITINIYRNGVPAPNMLFLLNAGSSVSGFGSYGGYDYGNTLQTNAQGIFVFRLTLDSGMPDQTVTVHVTLPSSPPYGPNEPTFTDVTVNFTHQEPYFNWGGLVSTLGFGLILPLVFLTVAWPLLLAVVVIVGLLIYLRVFRKKNKR